MPWTFRVKTFSIGTYFETKPIIVVQTRFRRQFQCLLYPDKRRIHMWVKKFMEHGTFLNLNAKGRRDTHSVRPKSARSPVNTKAVRDSVGHNIYMDKLFFYWLWDPIQQIYQNLPVLYTFHLWPHRMILSTASMELILVMQFIGECNVKHTLTLPMK
jgi:hypothetical protein